MENTIVEPFLGTASCHDIEFDCYGTQEGSIFELIQVAPKGGNVNFYNVLSVSVQRCLEAELERKYLASDDAPSFNFERDCGQRIAA